MLSSSRKKEKYGQPHERTYLILFMKSGSAGLH